MDIQKDTSADDKEKQDARVLPRVIFIRATMYGLLYPLLPFAMLKDDPIAQVRQYIKLYNIDTQDSMKMRVAWNKPFSDVLSDQLYFVCAWNSVAEASPRIIQAAGMTFVIASSGLHHKRWLTTRPMLRNGELVAWCEAIDMYAPQFERVITLSEANMIRLAPALQLPERRVA